MREAPPTVLLVVWDSVARERLPLYGGAPSIAPHLVALAEESFVLEDHVPSSEGGNAALASLLTGCLPRHHGVGRLDAARGPALGAAPAILAEAFAAEGFRGVAAFSQPELAPALSGLGRGFELCEAPALAPLELHWTAERTLFALRAALEQLLASDAPVLAVLHFSDARARNPDRLPGAGRFVAARLAPYREKVPELGEALGLLRSSEERALALLSETLLRRRGDPARAAYVEALYDARIFAMDAALGELLTLLEKSGRRERCLVALVGGRAGGAAGHGAADPAGGVLTGDPAPGLFAPFVLRLPGGAQRGRAAGITQDVDVLPTLLAALGFTPPAGIDGASQIERLLAGPDRAPPRDAALVEDARFETRVAVARGAALAATLARGEEPLALARRTASESERAQLSAFLARHPPLARLSLAWSGESGDVELLARASSGLLVEEGVPELRPRPVRSISFAASAPDEEPVRRVLRADGREPDLLLELRGPPDLDERRVWIGARSLAELDLGLALDARAEPWPRGPDGELAPARAAIDDLGAGRYAIEIGAEGDGQALAVIELFPSLPIGIESRIDVGERASMVAHPRRLGAALVTGEAPLRCFVRRPSGRALLVAAFLDERRVPAREVRVGDRRQSSPGLLSFGLPPGAWSDPAHYTLPPTAEAPSSMLRIELLDPAPFGPSDLAPARLLSTLPGLPRNE